MTAIVLPRVKSGFGADWRAARRVYRNTTSRRRDKSGSPVAIQALDRACLSPCRSVGARAAPANYLNDFKGIFGTVWLIRGGSAS
jgi:hypothetical protein